jgi:integrase
MAIKLRHQRYWLQVWVPEKLKAAYDNKRHVEQNLYTSDRKVALQRAATVEGLLRAEFAERLRGDTGQSETAADVRRTYEATFAAASAGEYRAYIAPLPGFEADPVADGIGLELDRIADAHGPDDPSPIVAAKIAGLQDASARHTGQAVPRRADYEPSFTDVADDFMKQWLAKAGTKITNTEQQKRATFKLFGGFWSDKPMRSVGSADSAAFHDAIRLLDPHWARKASNANQSWTALMRDFGGRKRGLSAATVNRHVAALKTLWDWAKKRGHCEGDNPFDGFHTKLRAGVNVAPYLAWEPDELNALLRTPPKRRDLLEVILVGLHSGMRLDEIASLTWGQVQEADGVTFFQVTDAKTPAGNRQVPVHPSLSWLTSRRRGPDAARLWPAFNPEGPGKKPGADAGRDFSRFKASRGFTLRAKAFHSFRKCVTRIMEQAGVPENDWAQVFGHERGFTYRVYNPDGITLARKAEMIALIAYPNVNLPAIAA